MSVTVSNITKTYGTQKAADDVSFTIPRGQTCGFLGPNGAGKSTVMKIITGYLNPDKGEVFINDVSVMENPQLAKQLIGYLPEHNPLYTGMYVREFLHFNAKLYGGINKSRIEETIDLVGLQKESHKKIGALSKGFKQRVGLAQAIIHDPEVLILDEPLNGLDPNQLAEIRELIIDLGKEKTLIFSSHILQEVEHVANRIILIKDGQLVHDSTNENISNRQYIKVELENPPSESLIDAFIELGVIQVNDTNVIIENYGKAARKQVFEIVKTSDNSLLSLSEEKEDLTQLFQSKTNLK